MFTHSPDFHSSPDGRLVLIDIDGVLLDYEKGFVEHIRSEGFEVPEDYKMRPRYHFSEWLPEKFTKEMENKFVYDFAMKGGMRSLDSMHEDGHPIGLFLTHPGVYILSSFMEVVRTDRLESLYRNFGYSTPERLLCSGPTPKGEVMMELAKRFNLRQEDCLLVDDVARNLDNAEKYGFRTLRVMHKHNEGSHHPGVTLKDMVSEMYKFYWGKDVE